MNLQKFHLHQIKNKKYLIINKFRKLFRWFVCSEIPFIVADSLYFEDFTKSLNSGYNPPK
jgi:hypothetical protein